MIKFSLLLPVVMVATITTICSMGSAYADLIDSAVFSVKGDVRLINAAGASAPVTHQTILSTGSRIVTGSDGVLAIVWMGGAFCVVENNTSLNIDSIQMTVDGGNTDRKISLRLINGSIINEMILGKRDSEYRVKTDGGDFITNGTQNLINFNKGKIDLVVWSGQVETQFTDGSIAETTSYHETTFNIGDYVRKVATNLKLTSQFGAMSGSIKYKTVSIDDFDLQIKKIKKALSQFHAPINNEVPTDVGTSGSGIIGSEENSGGSGNGNLGVNPNSAGSGAPASPGPSTTGTEPLPSSQFKVNSAVTTPMTAH